MPKTSTFSLYLAKPGVTVFDDLLTETARTLIEQARAQRTASDEFGDGAVLYTFPGFASVPGWVGPLRQAFAFPDNLYAQSPCAVVAFTKGESLKHFCLRFGLKYLSFLHS